jgi:hypothetical protein
VKFFISLSEAFYEFVRTARPVLLRVPLHRRCTALSAPADQLTRLRQGFGGFIHDQPALLHIANSG